MPKHAPSEPTPEMPAVPGNSGPPAAPPPEPPKWSRWVAPIALVFALIAVALAAWPLLHPVKASTTTAPVTNQQTTAPVTNQQIADAKARACTAFNTVHSAVFLRNGTDLGSDPVAMAAVAANARLAPAAGGPYLLARLDPATPPPLAVAIRSFADQLEDIAMNELAGVSNDDPAQAARIHGASAADTQIADLCK